MVSGKSKLAIKISDALERDERTGDAQIEVLDTNGVVTLTGYAQSDDARKAAGEIAGQFDGVTSVTNDIALGREGMDGDRTIIIPPPINNASQ